MDQERERIQADLRGLLEGEVRCDDVFTQLYASDASIYEIRPLGVVRPRTVSDVVACVQYAGENDLPLHARGAGTGVSGESLGPGLVLDFSHSMRRVLESEGDTVRLQPGVVLAQLNRHLASAERQFGPDPATRSVTTMGSVLALDASGSHWLQYGSARSHVVEMQVVLADGEVVKIGKHSTLDDFRRDPDPRTRSLGRRIRELVERESKAIEERRPKTVVNRSGYHLWDLLDGDQIDLAKLFVGSEGTLGIITEATVKTVPVPKYRGLSLLFFDRLESAAHGAIEVAAMGASACDMMDRRLLTLARESEPAYAQLIPHEAEALLLVEMHGDEELAVRDGLRQISVRLQRRKRLALDSRTTLDKGERDLYWRLARRVVPTLYQLKGSIRPLPFIEDIAVPPAAMPEFVIRLQNVFQSHRVTASMFAHAGHGQLHVRPFLDLSSESDLRQMQDLATAVYEEALDVGGTISGEHGDGLSRTWFVRRQYGPLYDVFREVKRIFDPHNIFNPGKVVADAPQPLTSNLRPVTLPTPAAPQGADSKRVREPSQEPAPLQLLWSAEEAALAARSCNGCGRCRTQAVDDRMCPIFRFAPREEATPRAKANLMRAVITGSLDPAQLAGDELKSLADLCVNCHQCRLECPAGVDIPKLMIECKAQYVATNGLHVSDWFMTRLDWLASWASLVRPFSNWALGNRQMRWLLEKVTGVAQGRKLPRLAARNFLRLAQRKRLTRATKSAGRKVVYFVDVYANWFDTQLAEALVQVLEHNGVAVHVAPIQYGSGMPAISLGALEFAKKLAAANVVSLADAVRQGYHVVTTEPSAATCLKREYLQLLDDDDARLVAENTSDACEYLWGMHQVGKLELDMKPINVVLGYHQPCHLREDGVAGSDLLKLIPGVSVQSVDKGCSGMAGTFGLKRENYRNSLRAGWGLISALRDPSIQVGVSECSACKLQMEQGTAKPTLHPLKILALAYGLAPEIAEQLTQRGEELIVT